MPAPAFTAADRAARRAAIAAHYAAGGRGCTAPRPLCEACADSGWSHGAGSWCACAGAIWPAPVDLVDALAGVLVGPAIAERLFALAVRGPRRAPLLAPTLAREVAA